MYHLRGRMNILNSVSVPYLKEIPVCVCVFTGLIPVCLFPAKPIRQVKVPVQTTWKSHDHQVPLPQTWHTPSHYTVSECSSATKTALRLTSTGLPDWKLTVMASSSLSTKTNRNRLRRETTGAPGLLLVFLTLFTCLLRCSECVKAKNMILIVADDLDVELGGMVSLIFIFMSFFFK